MYENCRDNKYFLINLDTEVRNNDSITKIWLCKVMSEKRVWQVTKLPPLNPPLELTPWKCLLFLFPLANLCHIATLRTFFLGLSFLSSESLLSTAIYKLKFFNLFASFHSTDTSNCSSFLFFSLYASV